jgi:D-tagatose-1,6-bisphosphate aldolase subunit GatZ/KbaZ
MEYDSNLIIESTCNQVNHYGGYTGMRPRDFALYISDIAESYGFPKDKLLLGGDHLGPYPWKDQSSVNAMREARRLINDYVIAGYRKIHLDTSMACADDDFSKNFNLEEQASRAADLCFVSEEAWMKSNGDAPIYIIGSEVPDPGGKISNDENIYITQPDSVLNTIDVYKKAFISKGLTEAWERVIGLVVQPGVEFSRKNIFDYNRIAASALSRCIENVDGIVYEAHSTDYQMPEKLKQMVEDHFCILKVGPALTFSFREAIFALAHIEKLLLGHGKIKNISNIVNVISSVMNENPTYWKNYYDENVVDNEIEQLFSFSDRIRYYWTERDVQNSLILLTSNLHNNRIPLSLISQYLPNQYQHIRDGKIENSPEALIIDHIIEVIDNYQFACSP